MPGFISQSLYLQVWDASGLPYTTLLDRLIELAFEAFAENNEIAYYVTSF